VSFCYGWHHRRLLSLPRFLTFKQALELAGKVRKGEHGAEVYFVKQLQVHDSGADDSSSTRLETTTLQQSELTLIIPFNCR
jgi:antirestriction protein ArdC